MSLVCALASSLAEPEHPREGRREAGSLVQWQVAPREKTCHFSPTLCLLYPILCTHLFVEGPCHLSFPGEGSGGSEVE